MRIGIVSDTHSQYREVTAALQVLRGQQVSLVLHCGDIEDADTVRLFAGVPTHFVFGNWDKDKVGLTAAINGIGGTLHEQFGYLELAERKISWIHGHDRALFQELEHADWVDYLFYGHSHRAEGHRRGRTLVVNPGALFRAFPLTVGVLDLETDEMLSLPVPDSVIP